MLDWSTPRIAWRNLGRNRRRTALAVFAIALAQIAVLWTDGLMNGWIDATIHAITGPMLGHVQVHAEGWREEQAMDLTIRDVDARLEELRAVPGVAHASARIYGPVLVAKETEAQAAMVVGLDVADEAADGLLENVAQAELPEGHHVLVGSVLARQAGLSVGDELVVVGQAVDGSTANDLYTVGGILATPVEEVDRFGVVMALAPAQELFVMNDEAHELTVRGDDAADASALAARIAAIPDFTDLEVLSYRELAPEMTELLDISSAYGLIVLVIVMIAAAAGVANTMLMATFERRGELGMMLAIGATPFRLVRMVLAEAIVTGLIGVTVGTALGAGIVIDPGAYRRRHRRPGRRGRRQRARDVRGQRHRRALPAPRLDGRERRLRRRHPGVHPRRALAGDSHRSPRAGGGDALMNVSARYAARSLGRSVRRTALSVVGIGFGVGIALFGIAWIQGEGSMTARAAAGGGIGHVRVAPKGFSATRDDDLRLDDGPALLEKVRDVPGVALAAPHARTGGLLALGTRSVRVELTGVDPRVEQRNGRFVRQLADGRYLRPGERGEVVLGRTLVERLDAELDDELVVTAVDESGDMQSALLVLVGIAESGSREIDSTIAHVSLADVAMLTGRAEIGEITVVASDVDAVDELQKAVAAAVGDEADVLSWKQVAPALVAGVATDAAFMNVATLMVFLVVLLGVASAQLTAVLERRKELAVLGALGMGTWALVRVMLVEGLFLGVLGAAAALAWSAPLIGHLSGAGVDLSSAFGEEQNMALAGVILDPIFYPEFGAWLFPTGLFLSLVATMVASLYPAVFAARMDPATALRVDR